MRMWEVPQPTFRYVHTCPRCGCHCVSYMATTTWAPHEFLKICSNCMHGYSEEDQRPPRETLKVSLDPALREIDEAVRMVRCG